MDWTSDQKTKPESDELEVSLFGPGFGECVVCHVGGGKWIVVDSCRSTGGSPIALEYLGALGEDAAESIALVVATHWHDDHTRGISDVVRAAVKAKFCCPVSVQCRDFATLVEAGSHNLSVGFGSGVDEFRWVLQELDDRGGLGPDLWGMSGRGLLSAETAEGHRVLIESLSPSDTGVTRSLLSLARLVPKKGEVRGRRLPNPGPNESSVVLRVSAGDRRVLLGADLEAGAASEGTGWRAVVMQHGSPERCEFFKVPHHGSAGADADEIWSTLLVEDVAAGVTPFLRGSIALPSATDRARLAERTGRVFLTSDPKLQKSPRRRSDVEKEVKATVRGPLRRRGYQMGHIRFRAHLGGGEEGRVDTFGAATAVA